MRQFEYVDKNISIIAFTNADVANVGNLERSFPWPVKDLY